MGLDLGVLLGRYRVDYESSSTDNSVFEEVVAYLLQIIGLGESEQQAKVALARYISLLDVFPTFREEEMSTKSRPTRESVRPYVDRRYRELVGKPPEMMAEFSYGGVDWHIHTWEGSRESKPVKEVVEESIEARLDAAAITDHNSVASIDLAIEAAQDRIGVIPGIELDAIYEGEKVHIFCFNPDYKDKGFQSDLDKISRGRRERMFDIVNKFADNQLILQDDVASVIEQLNSGKVYTTMAVAEILVSRYNQTDTNLGKELERLDRIESYTTPDGRQKGNINLLSKFMYEFLDKKRPCYVPYEKGKIPDYSEVVEFCTKYGAPSGFAHLMADLKDREKAIRAFNDGIDAGMTLLGVGHPDHSVEDQIFLQVLASSRRTIYHDREVIQLNGTDYHAKPNKPAVGDIRSPVWTIEQVQNCML